MSAIELGDEVQDRVTGYTGIVTVRHDALFTESWVTVETTTLQNGRPGLAVQFPVSRVTVLRHDALLLEVGAKVERDDAVHPDPRRV